MGGSRAIVIDAEPISVTIGQWRHPDPFGLSSGPLLIRPSRINSPLAPPRATVGLPIVVEPGTHEVCSRWRVTMRLERDEPGKEVAFELDTTNPIVVRPPTEGKAPIRADAAASEIIERAFVAQPVGIRTHRGRNRRKPSSILCVRFTTGSLEPENESGPLAPFNGSITIGVFSGGRQIGGISGGLAGGLCPLVVEDTDIASIDVVLSPDYLGRSIFVMRGNPSAAGPPQAAWMGPRIRIENIPVTWYETVDEAPLTEYEREVLR
jgi:hypothetical protein